MEHMNIFAQDAQATRVDTHVDQMLEQLKRLLVENINPELKLDQIDPDDSILEDGLGLDSIKVVELIVLIEKNFGFTFTEDELSMDAFASLRTLAKFVADRRGRQTV
ncbi:MAG: acyl carrier protein [Methylococcaceae bacterium]|nr:MAG: acyl carrier protein [Methylococcaceae bacterium]